MWLLTNGLYINAVLWETLATIGALDIAYLEDAEGIFPAEAYGYDELIYSRYDGLMCFRINPLGAFLFGQADAYVPCAAGGRRTFLGCGRWAHHAAAACCPLRRAPRPTGADRRCRRRRLSTFGAEAAGAAGDGAKSRPAARLSRPAQPAAPCPPAVDDLLRRVEEDSRALQIQSKALIIRVRTAAVAEAVLNDPTAGKLVRRLDDRTLLIPANKETALRNALRTLGYGLRGE